MLSLLAATWHFLQDPVALTRILGWVALAMLASLILLFGLVVVQRLLVDREAQRERRILNGLALALVQGRPISALPVNPADRLYRRAIARALAARGSLHTEHALLAAPWFGRLLTHLQRDGHHAHWGRRAAAYEAMGQLSAPSLRAHLIEAAHREQHPQAWGACLRAAARLSSGQPEVREIMHLLASGPVLSGSFNEGVFRLLIDAVIRETDDERAAGQLRELFAELESRPGLLHDALSASGKSRLATLAPVLAERYASPGASLDTRIAAIRALGSLAPAHPVVVEALASPDWQVQAQAARLVRDGSPATVHALRNLLCSPNFHVRRNSAHSLHQLGEAGNGALIEALAGSDPFAQAISRHALSLGGGARA